MKPRILALLALLAGGCMTADEHVRGELDFDALQK
jgi:hypothetical protein